MLVRMVRAPWVGQVGLGLEATEPNRVFASSEEAAGLRKREREKQTKSKEG